MKKAKIGLYGGTFDPLHFGHLNLAIEMLEIHHFEEIWFCPVSINPHKQSSQPIANIHHRLEMLKVALKDIPNCKVIDIEAKREGPSYTIDTLNALMDIEKKKSAPRQICLIIGDDAVPSFCRWHQPEKIIRIAPIFTGRRALNPIPPSSDNPEICQALQEGLTPTRFFDISSTEIRKRLAEGKYCGHLVPEKVLDYIYQNKLYFTP